MGFSEEEGWSRFMALRGGAWHGQPMAPSEERGDTAVRLVWVYGE